MKKTKIRELPNWPPDPGGTILSGYRIPTSEQAKLTKITPKQVDSQVTFVGEFEGHNHTYDYPASSEQLAESIREALRSHLGQTVFALGELEVELEIGDRPAA